MSSVEGVHSSFLCGPRVVHITCQAHRSIYSVLAVIRVTISVIKYIGLDRLRSALAAHAIMSLFVFSNKARGDE